MHVAPDDFDCTHQNCPRGLLWLRHLRLKARTHRDTTLDPMTASFFLRVLAAKHPAPVGVARQATPRPTPARGWLAQPPRCKPATPRKDLRYGTPARCPHHLCERAVLHSSRAPATTPTLTLVHLTEYKKVSSAPLVESVPARTAEASGTSGAVERCAPTCPRNQHLPNFHTAPPSESASPTSPK